MKKMEISFLNTAVVLPEGSQNFKNLEETSKLQRKNGYLYLTSLSFMIDIFFTKQRKTSGMIMQFLKDPHPKMLEILLSFQVTSLGFIDMTRNPKEIHSFQK